MAAKAAAMALLVNMVGLCMGLLRESMNVRRAGDGGRTPWRRRRQHQGYGEEQKRSHDLVSRIGGRGLSPNRVDDPRLNL